MSSYVISTISMEDSTRVFLGGIGSGYFYWTKDPRLISYFDTADQAKSVWNKMNHEFPAEMMEAVNVSTIFAGNLNFAPLVKLEVSNGSNN